MEGLAVDAPDNRGAAAGAGGAREPELRRPGAIACGPLGRYRAPRFCEPSLRSDNRAMFILLQNSQLHWRFQHSEIKLRNPLKIKFAGRI